MSTRRRLAALLVALAVLTSGCGWIPGTGGGGLHATVYFERAVSLYEASQVRVLGLPAGSVDEVAVEGGVVRVELTIDGDVPVPADVQATIIPLSLIGERYVQLFPAYTGGPRLQDDAVIPLERTTVPVEPDEALVSLRDFLDDLNPEGTRRLTENLAEDLDGQGESLNAMLREFSDLTREFGGNSEELGQIIDNFDRFAAALASREEQLGAVLDDFATVAGTLADEREHIASIVTNLSRFAADARDLVEEHGDRLGDDLETLARVAQALQANLDAVGQLLDAGPITFSGLRAAYRADERVIMLRDNGTFFESEGGQGGADPPNEGILPSGGEEPPAVPPDGDAPEVPETPFTPLDDLLRELRDEHVGPLQLSARSERRGDGGFAAGVRGFFRGLGGLARAVAGVA